MVISLSVPAKLANLSGAPPTPESRAPAAAGTATGAELPHLAGGSEFHSTTTAVRKRRPTLSLRFQA